MNKEKIKSAKERIQELIRGCDVDGRGILFEFTDTDVRDLIEEIGNFEDKEKGN
jgi:hypothetical protein